MAKARDESHVSGLEVRQQKLPLSWRGDGAPKTEAAPPAAEPGPPPAAAEADATLTPAEPTPAEPTSTAADAEAAPAVPTSTADDAEAAPAAPADPGPEAPAAPSPEGNTADRVEEAAAAAAVVVDGIGEMLLAARADSGFSIEDASGRTRIPRDVIEHLECNACDELPSEYYCRSHIEKLCALYNVDAAPILERFHASMVARRGESARLAGLQAVSSESESGARISYVLPGPGAGGRKPRSLSLTGAIVSAVIGLFLVMVLAAIIALHVHNRRADEPAPAAPAAGVAPSAGVTAPVPLQDFIVPEQLNAYELPIPDR